MIHPGDINILDHQVTVCACGLNRVDPASLESDIVFLFCTITVALEIFSKGAHVHIENSCLYLTLALFLYQKGFFYRRHAADGRAIVGISFRITRACTLKPGHTANLFAVTRPQELFRVWSSAAGHPFELNTGYNIINYTIPVGILTCSRIEGVKACSKNHCPYFNPAFFTLFFHTKVNGAGRTDLLTFPACCARRHVHYIMIWNIMRYWQVYGLSFGKTGIELIREFYRTDL